jgi:hypothetical protein
VIHYDPLSRVIKTDFPDGSFSKVEFTSWKQSSFDQNDTVKSSDWYTARTVAVAGVAIAPEESDAANKAFLHDSTPAEVYLDSLGRTFLTLTVAAKNQAQKFRTKIVYDIEGNQRKVIDAKANPVMQYDYDMTGNKIKQISMDAGIRIMLNDVMGKPFKLWDDKNQEFTYIYDELRRPIEGRVKLSDGSELLFDKKEYGDDKNDPEKNKDRNLRGQLAKHYDTAGLIENEEFDFKSNLLNTYRRVLKRHEPDTNWKTLSDDDLAEEKFSTFNKYDALNRVINSTVHKNNTTRHEFNVAGLLEKVFASVNGGPELAYVNDINYNEKGQRNEIIYGNGTVTKYFYDEKTFRLKRLTTSGQDNPGHTILFQDLQYTYDPAGNITQVKDSAQPTIYFGNKEVKPVSDYTYDALYQLIKVKGREHIGQNVINETNLNTNNRIFHSTSWI